MLIYIISSCFSYNEYEYFGNSKMVFVGYLYPGQTLFVQIVACFCIFYILLDTLRVENMVSVKSFIFLYFIQRQCFAFFLLHVHFSHEVAIANSENSDIHMWWDWRRTTMGIIVWLYRITTLDDYSGFLVPVAALVFII